MSEDGGYIRWRDLDAHREREAAARETGDARLSARLDIVESVVDQLRGARALIGALIGSNILAAVAIFAGWLR